MNKKGMKRIKILIYATPLPIGGPIRIHTRDRSSETPWDLFVVDQREIHWTRRIPGLTYVHVKVDRQRYYNMPRLERTGQPRTNQGHKGSQNENEK